jgi:hypothetical protein
VPFLQIQVLWSARLYLLTRFRYSYKIEYFFIKWKRLEILSSIVISIFLVIVNLTRLCINKWIRITLAFLCCDIWTIIILACIGNLFIEEKTSSLCYSQLLLCSSRFFIEIKECGVLFADASRVILFKNWIFIKALHINKHVKKEKVITKLEGNPQSICFTQNESLYSLNWEKNVSISISRFYLVF